MRSTSMTPAELLPGLLDLVDVGHVGHRAAGVEVREDDRLVVVGEDVGGLGHEVDAAEDDELGVGALLGEHRQAVAVAPGVGPADDLVALVVVAEDEQAVAEGRLGGADPVVEVVEVGGEVPLRDAVVGFASMLACPPSSRGFRWRTVGTAGSPHPRGCRPGNRYGAGYPAGVTRSVSKAQLDSPSEDTSLDRRRGGRGPRRARSAGASGRRPVFLVPPEPAVPRHGGGP